MMLTLRNPPELDTALQRFYLEECNFAMSAIDN